MMQETLVPFRRPEGCRRSGERSKVAASAARCSPILSPLHPPSGPERPALKQYKVPTLSLTLISFFPWKPRDLAHSLCSQTSSLSYKLALPLCLQLAHSQIPPFWCAHSQMRSLISLMRIHSCPLQISQIHSVTTLQTYSCMLTHRSSSLTISSPQSSHHQITREGRCQTRRGP